jgi:ATP-dependent DNA ligase
MHKRAFPSGFIAPCLPTKAQTPPFGALWLHEIKHDGFRVVARKTAIGCGSIAGQAMI